MSKYRPQSKQAELLEWCLAKVKSVPYPVTLRWVFYRAVQEKGLAKTDYACFKQWMSKARKRFYNGWMPSTLVDDTRRIVMAGDGYETPDEWISSLREYTCRLDKRRTQPNIVIVCFEAEAMFAQFNHYTADYYVSLVPFKGDESIALKWKLARLIEDFKEAYDKPVKVLYFGDLDKKGEEIPENAMRDVKPWSLTPFGYDRVGLNPEHVERWHLPENPEKPRQYQWEALPDEAAKELIEGALNKYINREEIRRIEELEAQGTEEWRRLFDRIDG